MASGSSRVLWKATNTENRKTAIDRWNGTTTLNPVKVFKMVKPEFAAYTNAHVIDTVKLTRPVDPSISQKDWNVMRQVPVTVDYMYQVLRSPLCTVAADKETKERLRKIAFAMRTLPPNTTTPRDNVPRTQRDRLVRLLTRLTGGKHSNRTAASRRESTSCGFDPAITYRLVTDAEMTKLGFTSAVSEAGKYKFFYKAKRHGLWSKNDKKYRIREYLAPSPKAGRNGHMPASKPLRVPQRIVQRGLQANGRNANAPWHREPGQKWSGSTSNSGVWKGRPATPVPSPRRPTNSPGLADVPLNRPGQRLNYGNFAWMANGPSEPTQAQLNELERLGVTSNPANARLPANQVPQAAPLPNFTNAELRFMEAVSLPRRQSATPRPRISSGNLNAALRANSSGLLPAGGMTNAQRRSMMAHLEGSPLHQPTPANSQRTKTNSGRAKKTNSGGVTSRAGRSRTPARQPTPARKSPPRKSPPARRSSPENATRYLENLYANFTKK